MLRRKFGKSIRNKRLGAVRAIGVNNEDITDVGLHKLADRHDMMSQVGFGSKFQRPFARRSRLR